VTLYDPSTPSLPSPGSGPVTPPPVGSATAAQSINFPFGVGNDGRPFGYGPGSLPLGPGGTLNNPLNFPGWPRSYPGSTWVYDWMLRHPRIQQARSVVFDPILASTWAWECEKGAEKAKDTIAKNWNALRPTFVPDALRAIDYGCAKFEPVWNLDEDGLWVITEMKALDMDRAGVWADYGGTFTGFSVNLRPDLDDAARQRLGIDASGPNLPAARGKAWLFTHDKKNGFLHGRSRLENLRETAWAPWLTVAQQLILLGGKISGRQAYGMVPPGGYTDPATNTTRTYLQDMIDATTAFMEGKCPVFTNLTAEAEDSSGYVDPVLKAKLASETIVKFGLLDFGNNAAAVQHMLAQLMHYEDLMFAGMLRSSRTGMQSQHGSRADSEQHTDTGVIDSQIIADSIPAQAQCLIDYQAKLNFNLPPGSVRIKQSPLIDREAQAANNLMNTMCQANKDVAAAVARKIDWEKQFVAAKIPTVEGIDVAKLLQEAADKPVPEPFGAGNKPGDVPPGGAKPGKNGNGRTQMDRMAADRLVSYLNLGRDE
jgi:hypothetical protein